MFSDVAATIISRSVSVISENEGLMQYCPFLRATLTSDIGPWKGISLTARAPAAASPASASGCVSLSADTSITLTKTAAWKSSGNKGLKALSTRRAIKIS